MALDDTIRVPPRNPNHLRSVDPGQGLTDLRDAIRDVNRGEESHIYLKHGTFEGDPAEYPITLPESRTWRIDGPGTVRLPDGADTDVLQWPDVDEQFRKVVLDFHVDGNRANNVSGDGLNFSFANGPQLRNCFFNLFIEELAGDGYSGTFDNSLGGTWANICASCEFRGVIQRINGHGIRLDGQVFENEFHTHIEDPEGAGIWITNTNGIPANNKVSPPRIANTNDVAVVIEGGYTKIHDTKIVRCVQDGATTTTHADAAVIILGTQSSLENVAVESTDPNAAGTVHSVSILGDLSLTENVASWDATGDDFHVHGQAGSGATLRNCDGSKVAGGTASVGDGLFIESTAGLTVEESCKFQSKIVNSVNHNVQDTTDITSGTVSLTAGGSAAVGTGAGLDQNLVVAYSLDADPGADAKVEYQLFWDDSATEWKVEFTETLANTGVTVRYDVREF